MLLEEEFWVGNGGGVSGVACGLGCGSKRSGGCPGRDFCSIGTLVVRMIGSSLLVDDEVEGGGRGGGRGRGRGGRGDEGVKRRITYDYDKRNKYNDDYYDYDDEDYYDEEDNSYRR